jgi:transcriptional regulator with XRE-family HTH domain
MEQPVQKNEKGIVPGVAVDGARVRSVREAKRLTQLYVANVVGVTTDTISRWENNRYPSIKRENAEKLAKALEVELSEILRDETVEEPPAALELAPETRIALPLLISSLSALLLLCLMIYFFVYRSARAPSAVRWVPHYAAPGSVVPIQVKITRPKGETSGFILKEQLPEGTKLVGALPPRASADSTDSSLKWLIPVGSASVTVSYTIQVPASATTGQQLKLRGEIVVRSEGANRNEAISGGDTIRIGAYHWADANGDGRIDDDEIMPAYYVCEAMKGLGLEWKTIEDIWSGKGYRWDAQRGYTVIK